MERKREEDSLPRFPPSHHTPRATKERQERETTVDESVAEPRNLKYTESKKKPWLDADKFINLGIVLLFP